MTNPSAEASAGLTDKVLSLVRSRFVRFLLVGGLNTLFGYLLFSFLYWTGLHYAVASFLSTVIGILFNFKTYGTLVFKCHDNRRIFRFFGVYGVSYGANVALLYIFDIAAVNMYLASFVSLLPVALLTYGLQKRFVFHAAARPTQNA